MKKAVVMLANGFEEIEALTVVDVLRRAKIKCDTCLVSDTDDNYVSGAHSLKVKTDKFIDDIDEEDYDCIILPGGMPGADNLKNNKRILEILKNFNKNNKLIAAICAAPIVLAEADVIKSRKLTSYPGYEEVLKSPKYCEEIVVQDGNLITARGPAASLYFAYKILENLTDKDTVLKLKENMMFNFVEHKIKNFQ